MSTGQPDLFLTKRTEWCHLPNTYALTARLEAKPLRCLVTGKPGAECMNVMQSFMPLNEVELQRSATCQEHHPKVIRQRFMRSSTGTPY